MTPGKRALDIALALVGGLLLLPVIGLVALVLLWREGRPLFHVSERMRTPQQSISLIKFRTMRPAIGTADSPAGRDQSSRISPTQARLRRTRLDELPQLWNVLKGDISFVGPRPPLRKYVEADPALYAAVLRSRPGITGLASLVFHRHEERILAACHTAAETDAAYRRRCVPRKARLDLIYQKRRNICVDVALIARTVWGALRRG